MLSFLVNNSLRFYPHSIRIRIKTISEELLEELEIGSIRIPLE